MTLARIVADPIYQAFTVVMPYRSGDGVRSERTKLFHTIGTAGSARIRFHPNTRYTGVLGGGDLDAFARMSVGSDDKNFVPGLGLVAFIGAEALLSVVAVRAKGLDAQPTTDFFAEPLCTTIPAASTLPARVLQIALGIPSRLYGIDRLRISLQKWAEIDPDGTPVPDGRAPQAWTFRRPEGSPTPPAHGDFRLDIAATVQPGDCIYEIYDDTGACVGELIAQSYFFPSSFADRVFHVPHASPK